MIVILGHSTFDDYYQTIKELHESNKILTQILTVETSDLSSCVLVCGSSNIQKTKLIY